MHISESEYQLQHGQWVRKGETESKKTHQKVTFILWVSKTSLIAIMVDIGWRKQAVAKLGMISVGYYENIQQE